MDYASMGVGASERLARGSGLSPGEGLFLFTATASSVMLIFMALSLPTFILKM